MPQPSEARTKCVELAQQLVNDYYEKSVEQAKNKSVSGGGNTTYAAPVDNRATDVHSVADELYSWYTSKSDEDAALAILEGRSLHQKHQLNLIQLHHYNHSIDKGQHAK